jgi:subtilisin family serine protease
VVFVSQLAPVAAATPQPPVAPAERGAGRSQGALLVRLKPGVDNAAAATLFANSGASELGRLDQISTRVIDGHGQALAALQRHLLDSPLVAAVEADGTAIVTLTPTDPLWSNEWYASKVKAPAAWDTTVGAGGPVIAVLDTGIQFHHPDLDGRVLAGWDFVNNDSNPWDDNGHGTMVAGVAAGAGMNSVGIAGMCWRCRILPVKVAGSHGTLTWSDAIAGILWATDHGADVINMSFGSLSGSAALADAVNYAERHGVVVVAAAGNEGTTAKFYPAAYPGILSVAATTNTDALYSFSTRGSWVTLAAPGCTWTSQRNSTWGSFCGTSAAAPVVAGTAALYIAAHPGAMRTEVQYAIRSSAVPIAVNIGGGRVNAAAALAVSSSADPISSPSAPAPPSGAKASAGDASAKVSWKAPAFDGGSAITGYTATSTPGGKTCSTNGALGCTVKGLVNGTKYSFTVRATNSLGTGLPSDPSNIVKPVAPDTTGPTSSAPRVRFLAKTTAGAKVSVRVQWPSASDPSGIARYSLDMSVNSGPWASVALPTLRSTAVDLSLKAGNHYRFRLSATDGVGNVGAYAVTTNSKLMVSQETGQAVSYSGGWKHASVSGALGGYVNKSANTGAAASYVFTGSGVAFVSTRALSRGIADIWLDGKKVATVDLYAKASQPAYVAWSSGVLTNTSHTVSVRVTGTKNASATSKRVDVDAFIGWQ